MFYGEADIRRGGCVSCSIGHAAGGGVSHDHCTRPTCIYGNDNTEGPDKACYTAGTICFRLVTLSMAYDTCLGGWTQTAAGGSEPGGLSGPGRRQGCWLVLHDASIKGGGVR